MPADVHAQHRFFQRQFFRLIVFGNHGVIDHHFFFFDDVSEQRNLVARFLFFHCRNARQHLFVHGDEYRARIPETIERARVNQTFHNALVDIFRAAHVEIGKVGKLSVFVAFRNHGFDGFDADAAKRAQPDSESLALYGENGFRTVDIRLQHFDAAFLHIRDILRNFFDFIQTVV